MVLRFNEYLDKNYISEIMKINQEINDLHSEFLEPIEIENIEKNMQKNI